MSGPVLFPLGTSRLHWPMEYLARAGAATIRFPGFGYFQSAGQLADITEWLSGAPLRTEARWVFRRDGTPSNPFDTDAFTASAAFQERRRQMFASAEVFLVEVSSAVEFSLDGAAVQGNPNADREVSFDEVWATGYYALYAPEIPVRRYEGRAGELAHALARIAAAVGPRPVICTSHIYRTGANDYGRGAFSDLVRGQAVELGWEFIDPTPYVDRYGYRLRPDGTTDIHHLSWPGTASFAAGLLERAAAAIGAELPEGTIEEVRQDRWEGRIA